MSSPIDHSLNRMVNLLSTSAVDRGFKFRSGQPKDYEISIFYFSAKHTALRRKSKDWFNGAESE